MKDSKKKYWRATIELQEDSLKDKLAHKEFEDEIPVESFLSHLQNSSDKNTSRRDFLKWMGFGTAAATLAACKGPIIKSIPYVVKPDSITPGIANYYASTFFDGFDLSSVLVKTREGKPIKIESNCDSNYFNSSSARMQASLLSLYDENRIKEPHLKGKKVSWEDLDSYVIDKLKKISEEGKQIVILSSSLPSPSTKALIADFSKAYHTSRLVTYDSLSYSYMLEAMQEIRKIRAIPHYNLENTELLVSFEADFLGDFSPQNLESDYAKTRKPGVSMMRHIQIESNMSLSGANADRRIPLKPSQIGKLLVEIYRILEGISSNDKLAQEIALEIQKKGSKALILAGLSKGTYGLSLLINQKIKSHGLSRDKFIYAKESDDRTFNQFLKDLKEGHVGALLVYNCDPVYSLVNSLEFQKALKNLDLSISFASRQEDSSKDLEVWAPSSHWLESWGDIKPETGFYTLMQPTIQPLFNTRQFQDSLLIWQNAQKQILEKEAEGLHYDPAEISSSYKHYDGKIRSYYDYLRNYWEQNILPKSNIDSFNRALFNGSVLVYEKSHLEFSNNHEKIYLKKLLDQKSKGLELKLYTKTAIGDGRCFDNPWLQELPDPITRTSWDNYLTISLSDAKKLNLKNWHLQSGALNGDLVDLKLGDIEIKNIPIYIQPGQAPGSVGLALGYGQNKGKLAELVGGINAYRLYKDFSLIQSGIQLNKTKGKHEFACVQLQHTLAGRTSIARETELEKFLSEDKEKWNEEEKFDTYKGKLPSSKLSLWKERDRSSGHHFNLSIDLNACTGCGACVIACHVENNVPVVGKEEIRNSRDMHWLRIDRYYSSFDTFESLEKKGLSQKNMFSEPKMYTHLLEPDEDNPQVIFQPVMCQHCNNAPCETVCPVAATSHSSQGQNMMAYNRCVGTRYCANNCPYKVRRFNWFNYAQNDKFDFHMNNDLGRMVLNPDVVVRSRGVMEKCSMCVQMSQATILKAKKEKRKVKDEEFQTACSKACPSSAIEFGDINDKESKVARKLEEDRSYKLLDFVGTRPNVTYQVKIRNSKEKV